MTLKEMDKLTAHFDKYFEQRDSIVLHVDNMDPHIDVLKYEPTDKYPFWKLVTMGASDYKMPGKNSLGNRNEYMIFVDPSEDLNKREVLDWYYSNLMTLALYPVSNDTLISYGHSVEWEAEEGEEMIGAYLEFPQVIEDTGILRCKLGLMKTAICLQAVLLNRQEMDRLLQEGPEAFSEFLYPEDDETAHFLSERRRSDRF